MKTKLIFFFLLLSSLSGFAQFTVKGVVMNVGYREAVVFVFDPDSTKFGCDVDSNGHFEFIFQKKGVYQINAIERYSCGRSSQKLYFDKDTNINLSLSYKLAYDQPCRKISKQNKIIINTPADKRGLIQFEKTTQTSKKMKLPEILSNSSLLILRIWEEGSFEYGGGTLYEISETKDKKWELSITKYKSNFRDLTESDSIVIKYKTHTEIFIYGTEFEIISKNVIDDFSEKWFIENGIDYLRQYIKSKDYCSTLSCKDNPLIIDGVLYLIELKYKSNYSVAFFHSPEITGKYDQIDSFLKIMEILKKRTQNQNR